MTTANDGTVLVLYTGGTIGMLSSRKQGYVPEPGYIMHYLRSQSRFHDPRGESLFSNSSSTTTYREWSALQDTFSLDALSMSTGNASTSSKELLHPATQVFTHPDGKKEMLESLITPPVGKDGRRVRYAIKEYDPLIDSPDVTKDDWIRLASDIESNYADYDGFVVLHGTDTMAYTSSALSFLLEDLGKTVIVTGAQVPFGQWRNDAVDNFLGSLVLAGTFVIPEVCLYFNETLMRGNRARKTSSSDFDAFQSPNLDPLAVLGLGVDIDWRIVMKPTALQSFRAHKAMNPSVAILQVFPDIPTSTVRTFLSAPVQGIVLETFGAGNIPQRKELMDVIREATARGVVIVNITQCQRGSVMAGYPGQKLLQDAGIVTGADMTPECALTKLSYLLSKEEYSIQRVRQLMATPLRGEMTATTMPTPRIAIPQTNEIHSLMSSLLNISTDDGSVSSPVSSPRLQPSTPDTAWLDNPQDTRLIQTALLPYLLCLSCSKNSPSGVVRILKQIQAFEQPDSSGGSGFSNAQGQSLINLLDPAFGKNALHVAAMHGSAACVEVLLGAGAHVHQRDTQGHTALFYAMEGQHEACNRLLTQAGAHLGGPER